jgi:hypothetical protein
LIPIGIACIAVSCIFCHQVGLGLPGKNPWPRCAASGTPLHSPNADWQPAAKGETP